MLRRSFFWVLTLVLACLLLPVQPSPAVAQENPTDATLRTATFLLANAQRPTREGRHHLLLRSLRQLRDPALQPLFEHLLDTDVPSLRIHGFLGLMESSATGLVDLSQLASVKDERLAAEMINAAMDNELLSAEQAQQILQWQNFDLTARLLVASRLIELHQFNDSALLRQLAQHESLAVRSFAGLLLMQLGDAQGLALLEALNKSDDPRKDNLRETLCRAALRQQFDKAGPWGMELATEPGVSARTGLAGLQVAMRFNAPGAYDFWQRSFTSQTDLAQQMRLALLALELSPWLPPSLFDVLINHADPTIAQIGRTGKAVASQVDLPPQIGALIRLQHPMAGDWAVRFARKQAPLESVTAIVTAVLDAYDGPPRHQAQRFDDVVAAVQVLIERTPQASLPLLPSRLTTQPERKEFQQAILLGLIRSRPTQSFNPAVIIDGLPPFTHPDVSALALLLQTKNSDKLTTSQLDQLAVVVRGGGDIPETLRLQAAWTWLKHTGQAGAVLQKVLLEP